MARPVERPRHHRTPFEFTINIEDAFDYLDEFKNSPDYPKTGSEMGITYTPNKYQILGDRLEARFGVDMVEARKIVSMWFERNNNLRTENKEIMKNIISERELKRMVKKVVRKEKLNNINEDRTDFEMSGARSRKDYVSNPRERDISSMFGKYAEDVPPIVIRYLRKNPEAIVKRLYKIYGDKIFDYLPQQEMEEGYDSYMGDNSLKIEIELPRDYVGQLEEAGFTQEQIIDYSKFVADSWFEDMGLFHGDMQDVIENMREYYGEGYDNYMGGLKKLFKRKEMSPEDIESAEGIYSSECGGCHGKGCGHCNYEGYVEVEDVNEEKWIQKAIEKPGSLRKKMGLKKGEKLTSSDIKSKLDSLKAKDKDPNKKGVQGLGKRDLKTYRQLNLAKTLRGL